MANIAIATQGSIDLEAGAKLNIRTSDLTLTYKNTGKFSSDRAILEYAKDLWHVDYRGKKK